MIGKPEWFTYRIFGWGLRPKKWQGWVYVAVIIAAIALIAYLPIPESIKVWLFGIAIGIMILDVIHIMPQLAKVHDERQNLNQLYIERNVSFAAVITLIAVGLYQAWKNPTATGIPFDYSILIVLIVMVLVKGLSTLWVNNKK